MKIIGRVCSVLATIALAVSFIGAGFLVCTTPPVTTGLSHVFSDDATSPFSRSQLVQVANATRDYAFGSHSLTNLYHTIYDVDYQLQQSHAGGAGLSSSGFPNLDAVQDKSDAAQYANAFEGASEMYCYSRQTIAHLDDCFRLAGSVYPLLAVAAVIALVGLIFTGALCRRRAVGSTLLAAGVVVLVALVALGIMAAVNFTGFFTTFHQLFFSQGNWEFPYDSLLICALPQAFWMGMGAIWLVTSVLVSILSIAIGKRLRK